RIQAFNHQQSIAWWSGGSRVAACVVSTGATRVHYISDINQTLSRASIDRRMYVAVTEIDFGFFDRSVVRFDRFVGAMHRRPIGFDRGIRRIGGRNQLLVLFTRHYPCLNPPRVPFDLDSIPSRDRQVSIKIRLSLLLQCNFFRDIRLRFTQRSLKRTRIDCEEDVALANTRAVGEMNFENAAGDLRLNRYGFASNGLSNGVDINRN